MNSDSGVQFVAARRRKRHHRELSATPQAQSWRQSGESSTATPRPSRPTPRYPGDGLDFRRPMASPAPAEEDEVIDLTNEPDSPDLPRQGSTDAATASTLMADIVDLEEEASQPPSSPEVQFVSANVRQRPPRPSSTQGLLSSNFWRILQLPHRRFIRPGSHPREDMENMIYRGFLRPRPNEDMEGMIHGGYVPLRNSSFSDLETLFIGDGRAGAIDLTINLDVDNPFGGNYQAPGVTREAARPRSSYKPPSPAPEGFTRSIAEDNFATCPNCDEELGIGDELKQQIWVAKQCGHVYCGECVTNRSLTKAKKTSSKTKPFAKCQVPECGKPISAPRSMFQIYL